MDEYGLGQWRFEFDRAVQRFGVCKYSTRTISLSEKMVRANSFEQCADTVLHEIAHALTPGAKHGPEWKQACRLIGAKPERCYQAKDVVVVSKYRAFCEHCGEAPIGSRQKRPTSRQFCRKHATEVVWKDAQGHVVTIHAVGYELVCDWCDASLGFQARRSNKQWMHKGCGGSIRYVRANLTHS